MDWSVTLVNSLGALITGAAASTTFKVRRIADDFLFDWDDSTFKAAGHTTPSVPLVEVSAAQFPGLYKKTVSEAAWSDGDYQGIARYAPVGGIAINGDMTARVRDGKEIVVSIGDMVEAMPTTIFSEALPGAYTAGMAGKIIGDYLDAKVSDAVAAPAAALVSYDAATGTDVTTSEGVVTGAISGLENISTGDVETATGAALATYTAAKTGDLAGLALAGEAAAALVAYDAATGTDVTTSEGVITGAIAGLNNLSSAQAQAAAAAAIVAADVATGTDVSTSEGVVTGAIAGLNDVSSGDVQAASAAALTAYDAATGADVTTSEGVVTGAISTSEGVVTGAISGLNDLSSGDAQAAASAALTAYDAATGTDVTASEGVITGAIGALNDLSSADAQAADAAALADYGAATAANVTAVPAATDVVLALAHGAGAWDGLTPAQTLRDAMKLSPSPGAPAAGSIDDQLADLTTDVGGVPAATDVTLSGTHGAGAWGAGAGLTPQQVRDAMKLAPTAGAPAAGSVDTHLDTIQGKTDNLPSDPADQSAVEAALTAATAPLATSLGLAAAVAPLATAGALATVDGVVDAILADTAAMDGRLPADPADESAVEAAIAAAASPLATSAGLTAAVAPLAKEATLVTTDGKVTAVKAKTDLLAFSGSNVQARVADKGVLNDLSSAQAQAADAAALAAYDAATGTDVTAATAPLATTAQLTLVQNAIAALNNLSIVDVQAALVALGYTGARAIKLDNLNATISGVNAAIAALNNLSSGDVQAVLLGLGYTALRSALLDHLDADVSDMQTAAQAALDLAALEADIAAVSGIVTTSAASVEIIRQVEMGRWKMVGNQMIFYEDDGSTPLLTFDLLDDAGLPTMDDVFERRVHV